MAFPDPQGFGALYVLYSAVIHANKILILEEVIFKWCYSIVYSTDTTTDASTYHTDYTWNSSDILNDSKEKKESIHWIPPLTGLSLVSALTNTEPCSLWVGEDTCLRGELWLEPSRTRGTWTTWNWDEKCNMASPGGPESSSYLVMLLRRGSLWFSQQWHPWATRTM